MLGRPRPRARNAWWSVCLLALVAVLAASVGAPAAAAQPTATNDYNQWVIADWQWRLSLPAKASQPGSCISRAQSGPVWFLSPGSNATSINCAIPAGRSIMLDAPSVECFSVGPAALRPATDLVLRHCALAQWRQHPGGLTVTVDGAALQPAGFIIGTSAFSFTQPRRDNLTHVPGHTKGRAAVYGSASILSPLNPGVHTLVERISYLRTSVVQQVVYHLTVG